MVALAYAGNVQNTCLRILRANGYELWIEDHGDDSDGGKFITYLAKKGEYDFAAPSALELLGLVAIYEYKNPQTPPEPYWWLVEGENIHDELFETAFGDE